jgi:hypothetical protein
VQGIAGLIQEREVTGASVFNSAVVPLINLKNGLVKGRGRGLEGSACPLIKTGQPCELEAQKQHEPDD